MSSLRGFVGLWPIQTSFPFRIPFIIIVALYSTARIRLFSHAALQPPTGNLKSPSSAVFSPIMKTGRQLSPKLLDNNMYVVPIYGGIYDFAYYFVHLFVGAPKPQRISVILDTGSSLLAFPCTTCSTCGQHMDGPFNVTSSSTAEWLACDGVCPCDYSVGVCKYSVGYEEGSSVSGYVFKDYVAIGDYIDDAEEASLTPQNLISKPDTMLSLLQSSRHEDHGGETTEGAATVLPSVRQLSDSLNRLDTGAKQAYDTSSLHSNTLLDGEGDGSNGPPRQLRAIPVKAYMGCHTKETNLFLTQQASGVMGVTFRSGGDEPTLIESLLGSTNVKSQLFSICLSHKGGLMTLGGYQYEEEGQLPPSADKQHSLEAEESHRISWTRILHHSFYGIEMRELRMEGALIGSADELQMDLGVMIDSGTTYTHLPPKVWMQFLQQLEEFCMPEDACDGVRTRDHEGMCWKLADDSKVKTFPKLTINIGGGASLDWDPSSYMYQLGDTKVWCIALRENYEDTTVLGMNFFVNRKVIFDIENDRIGFIDATCPQHSINDEEFLFDEEGFAEEFTKVEGLSAEKRSEQTSTPSNPSSLSPAAATNARSAADSISRLPQHKGNNSAIPPKVGAGVSFPPATPVEISKPEYTPVISRVQDSGANGDHGASGAGKSASNADYVAPLSASFERSDRPWPSLSWGEMDLQTPIIIITAVVVLLALLLIICIAIRCRRRFTNKTTYVSIAPVSLYESGDPDELQDIRV